METQDIVMIGGGASAVSFLCQLEQALPHNQTMKVTVLEKSTDYDLVGYAYNNRNDELILNTPADIMGVSPSDKYSFCKWLVDVKKFEYKSKFVPRYLFGEYLKYELNRLICSNKLSITLINELAVNCIIDENINIIYSKTHKINARFVVFSHGSIVDPIFTDISNNDRYIKDIYKDAKNVAAGSKVLILGTNLSMIDAVILLSQLNNKANNYLITAASRNAYFPSIKPLYPNLEQGEALLKELGEMLKANKDFDTKTLVEFLDVKFSKILGKPYSIYATLNEYSQRIQRNPLLLDDKIDQDAKTLALIYHHIDRSLEIAWAHLPAKEQQKMYEINKYLLTIVCSTPETNFNKLKYFLKDKSFSLEKLHQIEYKGDGFNAYFESDIDKAMRYDYVIDCTGIKGYYRASNSDLLAKNIISNNQVRIDDSGKIIVDAQANVYYKGSDIIIENVYAIGEVSNGPIYAAGCFSYYATQARSAVCAIINKYQSISNEK